MEEPVEKLGALIGGQLGKNTACAAGERRAETEHFLVCDVGMQRDRGGDVCTAACGFPRCVLRSCEFVFWIGDPNLSGAIKLPRDVLRRGRRGGGQKRTAL